jgi:hypothetical protein
VWTICATSPIINNPHLDPQYADRARDEFGPLLHTLVDRAREQGTLRPDFAASDVVFLQYMLAAVMDRTRTIEPRLYRRYVTMFLDGIRTDRGALSELPAAALDEDRTQSAMRT